MNKFLLTVWELTSIDDIPYPVKIDIAIHSKSVKLLEKLVCDKNHGCPRVFALRNRNATERIRLKAKAFDRFSHLTIPK